MADKVDLSAVENGLVGMVARADGAKDAPNELKFLHVTAPEGGGVAATAHMLNQGDILNDLQDAGVNRVALMIPAQLNAAIGSLVAGKPAPPALVAADPTGDIRRFILKAHEEGMATVAIGSPRDAGAAANVKYSTTALFSSSALPGPMLVVDGAGTGGLEASIDLGLKATKRGRLDQVELYADPATTQDAADRRDHVDKDGKPHIGVEARVYMNTGTFEHPPVPGVKAAPAATTAAEVDLSGLGSITAQLDDPHVVQQPSVRTSRPGLV